MLRARTCCSALTWISPCISVTRSSPCPRFLLSAYSPTTSRAVYGTPVRPFHASSSLSKKGGKAVRDEKKPADTIPDSQSAGDFTAMEAEIAALGEKLKDSLSKLRSGGRFNTDLLDSLRVQLNKNEKETVKLSDVAQIIPKGRVLQLLVSEKDYVKPVSSAIQGSNLSLTPQPDPTGQNPLLLTINIPPPTAESRKAVVNEAMKAGEKIAMALRDVRGKQQKKHRALQVAKAVRPDDLHKAGVQMEKIVEKAAAEFRRLVDSAKKVLESG